MHPRAQWSEAKSGVTQGLSPFELKNKLVELAKHRGERMMLNAGRGNPNWIALEPRAAFFRLGEFAVAEARRVALAPDFGGLPKKRGIAERLRAVPRRTPRRARRRALLERGIDYARGAHGFDPDLLRRRMGGRRPRRPLSAAGAHARARRALVRAHLVAELFGGDAAAGRFDLFAVEGASAGITYVFQSLVHSRLLAPGDRIALGVPIFTPYLEVPRLPEYRFELVEIAQDEARGLALPAGADRQAARSAGEGVPRRESVEPDRRRDGSRTRRAHRRRSCASGPTSS